VLSRVIPVVVFLVLTALAVLHYLTYRYFVLTLMCFGTMCATAFYTACQVPLKASTLLLSNLAAFAFWTFFVELYAVKCQSEWRDLAVAKLYPEFTEDSFQKSLDLSQKNLTHAAPVVSNVGKVRSDGVMSPVSDEELIDFCSDDNVKQNRSMRPIWSLVEYDGGECSGLSCITKGALPCSYFTCTLFMASEQKESACIVVLLSMILLNLVYVLVPVDLVLSKPCSAVGLKIGKKWVSWCWTVVFGGGSCTNWMVWLWVFFLPQWGICYVVLSGNLNNDLGSVATSFVSDILQDTQILLSAAVLAVLGFVAYLKREYITELFGVKRHYIHLGNWNHDRLMTDEIRLCIWRVDAYTEPKVTAKKAPQTTMFSGMFTTAPAIAPATGDKEKERRAMKMAAVGRSVQMFVRCCYGHNEDSATRVLNVPALGYAPTFFGETFVVHLQEEDDWFGHPPSMHLQVLDQNAIGSATLGEVVLDIDELESFCTESMNARKKSVNRRKPASTAEPGAVKGSTDLEYWSEAEQFALEKKTYDEATNAEAKDLGFEVRRLRDGGTIWVAFVTMPQSGLDVGWWPFGQ